MDNQPVRTMDGLGPEDMAIPEVKLIQNVGGFEAKAGGAVPGDFYCTVTGEIIKGETGFDIVVVDIRKQRTYWGRTEIEDEPPICASPDAKINMNGENCDRCPYEARCDTPWTVPAAERRNKCLPSYIILAIDTRNYLPILARASGISTQSVRELLTTLRLNKQLKGEYHRAMIHVTSQTKKTPSGDAFAMVLRSTGLISDAKQVEELKDQSLQLLGVLLLPEGVTASEETSPQETVTASEETSLQEAVAIQPQEVVVQPQAMAVRNPPQEVKARAAPAISKTTKVASEPDVPAPKVVLKPIDTDF